VNIFISNFVYHFNVKILQTISQLELRIAELRAWLYEVEAQLKKPLVFESCSKEVVELKIQEHEVSN
jgi:hypothetical protein